MPAIIFKRGKKRVLASVQVNLVRRRKLFPDTSKESRRAAVKWEKETETALRKFFDQNMESVSIETWMCDYLSETERVVVHKTFQEKQNAFKELAAFSVIEPQIPVNLITMQIAERFLKEQFVARSGNAANKIRKNLATAWDWGKRWYESWPKDSNPFRLVDRFPTVRFPRYIPSESDFWKTYDAAEDHQDRVILLTFLHTAARRSEVFRLKRIDIDLENSRLRLWTRKRESGSWEYDWLPMTTELKSELITWLQIRLSHDTPDKDHVFVCLRVGVADTEYYGLPFKSRQKFMTRLCQKAGVAPFGFHAIRHLSASILYRKGYSLGYIQEVLRHKNSNTTDRYLKTLGLERIRKALENGLKRPGKVVKLHDTDTGNR